MTSVYRKTSKFIKIEFERNYVEVPYDNEIIDFFSQIEFETAKAEDVHVAFAYFHIYWPFKTIKNNGKDINYPQLYRGFIVRERRG